MCINPDAHSVEGIADMHWGVCAARKGGLLRAQTLNALPLEAFENGYLTGVLQRVLTNFAVYASLQSLIKFSSTVFALPFALIGFFLALQTLDGPFPWTDLLLVLGCMVFARSAAMALTDTWTVTLMH